MVYEVKNFVLTTVPPHYQTKKNLECLKLIPSFICQCKSTPLILLRKHTRGSRVIIHNYANSLYHSGLGLHKCTLWTTSAISDITLKSSDSWTPLCEAFGEIKTN